MNSSFDFRDKSTQRKTIVIGVVVLLLVLIIVLYTQRNSGNFLGKMARALASNKSGKAPDGGTTGL